MAEKQKDYFSTREAAELLSVAVSTIQLWTNSGLLVAWTTVGGHRRIARSSVEKIRSQQKIITSDPKQKTQLTVVVVEDNKSELLLYEKQLAAWRMNALVVTAKDGYEGLIKIGRTLPHIIITDLIMPNMDGFQMIRALKELKELVHSTIIVVTALTEDEIVRRGGLPEGVHLFNKPIPFGKLKTLLNQTIQINTE